MGEIWKVLLALLPLFAAVVVLRIIVAKLEALKRANGNRLDDGPEPVAENEPPSPYRTNNGILSDGELAFFSALCSAMPALVVALNKSQPPLLLAKVRLADAIAVDETKTGIRTSAWWKAFNGISSKHIDFLLCNPVTTKPILAIELDDATHQRKDRKARDENVDAACKTAGLAILHVPAAMRYDSAALANRIAAVLPR